MTLFFILSFIAGTGAFLLFAAGRLVGGSLDSDGAHVYDIDYKDTVAIQKALQGIAPPDGFLQRIGRWINTLGDRVQEIGALALVIIAAIVVLVAGTQWYKDGTHSVVLVFSLFVAGSTLFYLMADLPERKKRAMFTSTIITISAVGVVLVNVLLANNAAWFQVKVVTVEGEKVIPTPNGTIVSVPELFGPAWTSYLDNNQATIQNCGALNVVSGNFELRQTGEGQNAICEMRSTRLGVRRGNLARGEYASIKEMQAARQTPPKVESKPWSTAAKFQVYFAILAVFTLVLALIWRPKKKEEKPTTTPTTTPDPAAPVAPAAGGHHP